MKQVRFLPRLARLLLAALGAIVLTACGGGGGGSSSFGIGGKLSGLAAGQQVTLLDNGGDAITLSADGTFQFATKVSGNASFLVTVSAQPAGQVCTVGGGSGAGVTADVSSIQVVCSTQNFGIAGSLGGLGAGQSVTLLNNGSDPLTLTGDGAFSFATPVAYNGSYAVTVGTQPAGQTCTVSGGSGAGVTANVSSVSVVCSAGTYTVGGSLSGLGAGQQLTLMNNAGDPLTLAANGTFSFATPLAYNGSYAVTVGTQPTGQTCTVVNGSGTGLSANVSNVTVNCSPSAYTIGGSVNGLSSGQQVTLLDNAGDALTVNGNVGFTFATALQYGSAYAVTIGTQPAGQTCTVVNGSGTGLSANVSNVTVNCSATATYTIGGTVSGLNSGQQVTLLDNGGDALTVNGNVSFTFATALQYGSAYAVAIGTQPTGQTCTVTNGSGTGLSANVSNVNVSCTTYTVSGTLSGLTGGQQVTLLNNGGDALTLSANGGFTFATPIAADGSYLVSVGTQPTGQTCTVNGGVGYHVAANITHVTVACSSSAYTVSVNVSGLAAGQQFTLLDNGSDSLVVKANGTASFANTVAQGAAYVVTFQAQPASQTCSVSGNSGVGPQATATVTKIVCSSSTATIGGTLSGLAAGQQLTLLDNSADPILLSANGNFVFPASVPLGGSYTVVVGSQPTGQVCSVANDAGYPVAANVSSVSVTCVAAMHAYVVNNVDATVSQYLIGGDGSLSPLTPATVSTAPAPTDIVVDSSGKYAYVVAQSSVSQYVINADGTLSPMTPSTVSVSGTPKSISIDPQGRWVYVSTSASLIEQYAIGSGGALTPLSPSSVSASSPGYGLVVDPTSRYVYLTGSGVEYQFSIGSGGLLSSLSPASVNVGGTLWGLAAEATGHYVYVPVANSRGVQQLTIGPSGQLSVNGMISVGTSPEALAVDPTGRYIYVVNGPDNTVSQLAIVPGGSLIPITSAAATATRPVHVAVDPTGRYLYVANATSANVSQFAIGPGGVLSPLSTASVATGTSPAGIAVH